MGKKKKPKVEKKLKTGGQGLDVCHLPKEEEDALENAGAPIPSDVRNKLEQRFNADLSDIRIHAGTNAHRLTTSLGAEAFTYENHIVFKPGEFSPHTDRGLDLLAHELTHVIQQASGVKL